MSERQRLPNRRRTTTFDFELHGLKFTASFSRFADARIAEIFLQRSSKPSSQSNSNARDAAVATSLALQHGCPLTTLQNAVLRDANGTASMPLGAAIDRLVRDEGDR